MFRTKCFVSPKFLVEVTVCFWWFFHGIFGIHAALLDFTLQICLHAAAQVLLYFLVCDFGFFTSLLVSKFSITYHPAQAFVFFVFDVFGHSHNFGTNCFVFCFFYLQRCLMQIYLMFWRQILCISWQTHSIFCWWLWHLYAAGF